METPRQEQIELTEEQLLALAAPVRDELLGAFVSLGPMSVATVAKHLGRPPKSLYYQVRKMAAAGLLRQAGAQGTGPRKEALFDAVAHRYVLRERGADPSYERLVGQSVKAALRVAGREFAQASGVPDAVQLVLRVTAHLSPDRARQVGEMLKEVERFATQGGEAEPSVRYTLTVLLSPTAPSVSTRRGSRETMSRDLPLPEGPPT